MLQAPTQQGNRKRAASWHLAPVGTAVTRTTREGAAGAAVRKRKPSCVAGRDANPRSHCGRRCGVKERKRKQSS